MSAEASSLSIERRGTTRYPLILAVYYRVQGHRDYGVGSTINIGSEGVLFRCGDAIRISINDEITVEICWPALLNGTCLIKLVMSGRVAWCEEGKCAVRAYTHEFRTAGKRTEAIIPTQIDQPAAVAFGG